MTQYPGRAIISVDALRENLAAARTHLSGQRLLAVVKADAYGHGVLAAARAFLDAGADYLGVAELREALDLSAALGATRTVPIFSWIFDDTVDFREAAAAGIEVSVGATWVLDRLEDLPAGAGIPVHIGVDTGMAREGFAPADVPAAASRLAALEARGTVRVVGLWSHLACADDPARPEATARQVELFEEARRDVRAAGIHPDVEHLAASSGVLWHPEALFSMVRPGIILYGLSPNPAVATAAELGIRPAMRVEAPIIADRWVKDGTGVSYGHTAHATGRTHLGIVPLGYADGIPRAASNRCEVSIRGQRAPIIGRVCMDQFVVRLPENARPGEMATLFGSGSSGEPTADEWAERIGTIGYEIITRIGPRVPRVYEGA
ncbi:alanine racemase [Neoactinobaculum massilliense]|uniref:alanine racemase n=1 Tax=Neoactinobaculum massilliense TaxID=2364794 RepID=UPI001F14BE16|nr:alanine racemase [Neoactinobaculum massilliense]